MQGSTCERLCDSKLRVKEKKGEVAALKIWMIMADDKFKINQQSPAKRIKHHHSIYEQEYILQHM